jgi:hypothetical protein
VWRLSVAIWIDVSASRHREPIEAFKTINGRARWQQDDLSASGTK